MNYYMLLLRNELIDFTAYSPEEMQKIMMDFDAWNQSMIRGGRLIVSGNLKSADTRVIRKGNVVTDGPYSEVKEAVAGFLLIRAENDNEAKEHASGCPFISRGGSVEVRMVPQFEFEDATLQIVEDQVRARAKATQEEKKA